MRIAVDDAEMKVVGMMDQTAQHRLCGLNNVTFFYVVYYLETLVLVLCQTFENSQCRCVVVVNPLMFNQLTSLPLKDRDINWLHLAIQV